jgi:hypothetical protein
LFEFPDLATSIWGTAVWNTSTWYGYQLYEGFSDIQLRARRFSMRFFETSRNVYPGRSGLGAEFGELGGVGLYLVEPYYTQSSRMR